MSILAMFARQPQRLNAQKVFLRDDEIVRLYIVPKKPRASLCLRVSVIDDRYFTASAGIAASSQRSRRVRRGSNFTLATTSPAKLRMSSDRASARVMPRA